MGIDVGTAVCKAAVFDMQGTRIAELHSEYDVQHPQDGWAQLDAVDIWETVKKLIARAAHKVRINSPGDPVRSLAISSLGEAVVPVTADRRILGPSILFSDKRGGEYLDRLRDLFPQKRLYEATGNVLGNHYSLTKLLWIRENQPEIYEQTGKFLHWAPFISFMLGAEPAVDFSLANRTLLFDINSESWSDELINSVRIDKEKLPDSVPSGTPVGTVSDRIAEELGLQRGVVISAGAHDQCAGALGCGVIDEGSVFYGMGTVVCAVPVFNKRENADIMIPQGLNTEHHAVQGRYVSFIFNQGGCLVKWFRDTFASVEHARAVKAGRDIYADLFRELPSGPSRVLVLPHFGFTGPPEFLSGSSGVMTGLQLTTKRGEILKGMLEGSTYYIRECVDRFSEGGTAVNDFRAAGGGSKSDRWLQLCADIFARPFIRPKVTETGVLGAAMLGGIGNGDFLSPEEAVACMVKSGHVFEPDMVKHVEYERNYRRYREIWPAMKDSLIRAA